MTRRLPDLRARALKARHLFLKNIFGEELAARLKCSAEQADALVHVGKLILNAEGLKLTKREREVLKVIARVIARNVMLGDDRAKIGDVDFAAGKRSGWSGRVIPKLVAAGLVEMPMPFRLTFTRAGWAFVWATRLITPTWKVPA